MDGWSVKVLFVSLHLCVCVSVVGICAALTLLVPLLLISPNTRYSTHPLGYVYLLRFFRFHRIPLLSFLLCSASPPRWTSAQDPALALPLPVFTSQSSFLRLFAHVCQNICCYILWCKCCRIVLAPRLPFLTSLQILARIFPKLHDISHESQG